MPDKYRKRWEGPIRGLQLSTPVWRSLEAEGITTLGQLKVVADQLERLVGIGPKTARTVRDELARVEACGEQPSGEQRD